MGSAFTNSTASVKDWNMSTHNFTESSYDLTNLGERAISPALNVTTLNESWRAS
jgi:hypothetical protein